MESDGNSFPNFSPRDPARKALNHKFLNSVTGAIENLSMRSQGETGTRNASGRFPEQLPPGAEPKLAKVLEYEEFSGTLGFTAPIGEVNVIKVELTDAVFEEAVGTQDLTEVDSGERVVYAAASPSFTTEVDSYIWVMKWSNQWWVLSGGGGGGSSVVLFTITDSEECGTGCVDATVTLRACGLSSPEAGETIVVEDEAGCFFNVDPVLLLGLKGFAIKMEGAGSCDPYSTEDCHWVVFSLCCATGGCP